MTETYEWSQPSLDSPLYGNRKRHTYRIDLLDSENEFIEELTWADGARLGVMPGGSLDLSNATDTRESAQFTILRDREEPLDWLKHRLRVWYTGDGVEEPQPLSTLLPVAAPLTYPSTHVEEALEVHGMLAILQRSTMGTTFGVAQDRVVTDVMNDILGTSGVSDFNIVPSPKKTQASRVWDANATQLRILNDLAESIGYWAMSTTEMGSVVSEPITPLDARELAWVFDDGSRTGLYLPGWSRDRDLRVVNRVTVIQRVEGDWENILTATAELPPDHPQSFENVGFYYDRVEPDVDFVTEEDGYLAALRLLGQGVPYETRTIVHPWLPGLRPNVKVLHRQNGVPDLLGSIQNQSIQLKSGGLVTTKIVRSGL